MNIVTYAAQNMKPFQDQAFHSVDSLILSCVVYMHFPRANPALCDWDGVPLPALFHAEDFDTIFEHVYDAPASKELLIRAGCQSSLPRDPRKGLWFSRAIALLKNSLPP